MQNKPKTKEEKKEKKDIKVKVRDLKPRKDSKGGFGNPPPPMPVFGRG